MLCIDVAFALRAHRNGRANIIGLRGCSSFRRSLCLCSFSSCSQTHGLLHDALALVFWRLLWSCLLLLLLLSLRAWQGVELECLLHVFRARLRCEVSQSLHEGPCRRWRPSGWGHTKPAQIGIGARTAA